MRFLAVDIGNSRVKCGQFEGSKLEATFEMASDRMASGAAYRHAIRNHVGDRIPQAAAISSVVPELTQRVAEAIKREFMILPEIVRASDLPPDIIGYDDPSKLGSDRIAAAVAAHHRYGRADDQPRPVIVVDAGTAVTFEVVDESGRYVGGVIWAGPGLVSGALEAGTSLLPAVDARLPKRVIGTDTDACIRSGTLYGFLDGATGIVRRLRRKAGSDAFTVSTGGFGQWLADRTDLIQVYDADLVLYGIRLIVDGGILTSE